MNLARADNRKLLLLLILIAGLATTALLAGFLYDVRAGDSLSYGDVSLHKLVRIVTLVKRLYVDPVNVIDLVKAYVARGTVNGMLWEVLDPYSRYLTAHMFEEMRVDTSGEYSGIGIVITVHKDQLTVVSPIEGTPGHRAGLQPGDRIIMIDDRSTVNMSVTEAADLMRGEEGTKVELLIERGEGDDVHRFHVEVIRSSVEVPVVKTQMLDDDIGYIRLNTFNERSQPELRQALAEVDDNGGRALILDLRGNPGGLLKSAIEVANLFIRSGPIVHIVDKDGNKQSFHAFPLETVAQKPIVTLVDKGSASASEILAGALRDHGVAVLIGTRTFGKGLVQTVIPLPDGDALSLTTARYLTAGGHSIDETGVEPDIVVEQPAPEDGDEEARVFQPVDEDLRDDVVVRKAIEVLHRQLEQHQLDKAG